MSRIDNRPLSRRALLEDARVAIRRGTPLEQEAESSLVSREQAQAIVEPVPCLHIRRVSSRSFAAGDVDSGYIFTVPHVRILGICCHREKAKVPVDQQQSVLHFPDTG